MSTSPLAKNVLRSVVAITAITAIGLGASACDTGKPLAGTFDKTEDFSWKNPMDAKNDVPDWIPATAVDIKERARTAGTERILSFAGFTSDLPSSCSRLPIGAKLTPQPEDEQHKAADFRISATLESEWWPAGQEGKTSFMCGHWWVSSGEGKVYAFTPELKAIAKRITSP